MCVAGASGGDDQRGGGRVGEASPPGRPWVRCNHLLPQWWQRPSGVHAQSEAGYTRRASDDAVNDQSKRYREHAEMIAVHLGRQLNSVHKPAPINRRGFKRRRSIHGVMPNGIVRYCDEVN